MIDLMSGTETKEATRKTYANDGYQAVLLQRVKNRELLRLTTDDAVSLDLDDTTVWKQKKVKEKAVNLFTSIQNGRITNRVIMLGFEVLREKGSLTGGPCGNLYRKLMLEGYSAGTAHAQSCQIITLFRLLRITMSMGSRRWVPNPDSLVLERSMKCLPI